MKSATISKLFNWLSTKWPIALFVILVLLLTALTSCTTTRKMSTSSNSQHQQTQTRSNEQSRVDRTVVFDTLYEVVVETLWREPDSVGKTYPLKTTKTEMTAGRQTESDIVTQSHDTIYIHNASERNEKTDSDIRAPTTTSQMLPWMIIIGMIVIAIIILAIRIMMK